MNIFRTGVLIAGLTSVFLLCGFLIGGEAGMLIALVAAVGMNGFAFWNSDKIVLRMYGAREVNETSAPGLYGIVRQLAVNAELPMPRVYTIDNAQPNAFATGRNPENAAVAATTGLLERLNTNEIAGVMAHELAHVPLVRRQVLVERALVPHGISPAVLPTLRRRRHLAAAHLRRDALAHDGIRLITVVVRRGDEPVEAPPEVDVDDEHHRPLLRERGEGVRRHVQEMSRGVRGQGKLARGASQKLGREGAEGRVQAGLCVAGGRRGVLCRR